jgi:hypothetical protein
MTPDRDIERLLDGWLSDGPIQVADRVIDDVAARITRQPQRPAWRLQSWRFPTVSTTVKLALIGAALVAALLGSSIFLGGGGRGPTATPSPTPTATPAPSGTPIPSSSPSAAYPAWFTGGGDGAGLLPAGRTATRQFLPGSTFTVPDGWVNEGDFSIAYTLFPDSAANAAEYGRSRQTANNVLVTDRVANNMFAICEATGLFQGTTASEVVNTVTANPAFRFWASAPIDVTIGGLKGREVDLQLSPEWTGTCRTKPDDPPMSAYLDARSRLIVLDKPVAGTIGIAISSSHSADHEAFLADATPIVESFQFDLGLGPTPRP